MSPAGPGPDRVFLVGYYGFDNLGDDAIRTAIEQAADDLGVAIPWFASRGPSTDPRAVRTSLRSMPRYVRAVLGVDRVVLGGGGILKDEGLRLPLELFATALLARLTRREVTLAGVGAGPFYRGVGKWLIRATARLASVRTVRDDSSATALRGLGVGGVEVGADPIFALRSDEDAGPRDALPIDRSAIVSVRPWFPGRAAVLEERRASLRTSLATVLTDLVEDGWRVRLVAMHWPRDRDEARRIVDEAGLADRVEVVDQRLDWPALMALVASADLVVTMRYHCLAAAALAGRPTIALAYEPKVASLAARIAVPTVDVQAPDLAAQVQALVRVATDDPPRLLPDATVVAELRTDARRILRHALTGRRGDGPDPAS